MMKLKPPLVVLLIPSIMAFNTLVESEAYQKKAQKLAEDSVFTKIIKRKAPADIVYDDLIAFVPLRPQAPVHYLNCAKRTR